MSSEKVLKGRSKPATASTIKRAPAPRPVRSIPPRFHAFSDYVQAIDREMQACIQARGSSLSLYGMMEYHLGWKGEDLQPRRAAAGKRSRSLICLLSCGALGGPMESLVPVAAAVELVHNFSLVFDDIQDASPLRRGRPTVWKLWGVPQAINVAAGMQALATEAVLRSISYGVSEDRALTVLRRLNETIILLCEGQFRDLQCETGRTPMTAAEYLEICAAKTASLIQTAAYLGAFWGTHDVAKLQAFEEFGHGLGMAYQLFNDIEGIWGEEPETGKLPDDIANRKRTFPILVAFEHGARSKEGVALFNKYRSDQPFSRVDVEQLQELLARAQARAICLEHLTAYKDLALRALERAGEENEYVDRLRRIVAILLPGGLS